MIAIGPDIALDEAELVETFLRASGPGGQNVNKVETYYTRAIRRELGALASR
jgi:protein subunit release factor B